MQRKSVLSQETVPRKGCTSNFADPERKLLVVLEEPETWDNSEMDTLFSKKKEIILVKLIFNDCFFVFFSFYFPYRTKDLINTVHLFDSLFHLYTFKYIFNVN